MSQGNRFSYEDRKSIESMLDQGHALKTIAEEIGFNETSISREVLRNRIEMRKVKKCKVKPMTCQRFEGCKKRRICSQKCTRVCRSCSWKRCEDICPDFKKIVCTTTMSFPHVCNSCSTKNRCLETRYAYRAKYAQEATEVRASQSRSGIDMTTSELMWLSDIVTPLIRRKQSVSVILKNHPEIAMSPTTLYRYIDLGRLGARNIDLVRAVKMKKRNRTVKDRTTRHSDDGRSYDDFLALPKELQDQTIEMDTVIGRKGGKTLLTFCSRSHRVLYAHLMEKNTAACVIAALDSLEEMLIKANVLVKLYPLILLTDNGSEFSRSEGIEMSAIVPDAQRCKLYHCDPYSSWQKPYVENAHALLRRILPKKTSFDGLTQEQVNRICSHINSYARRELKWNTPFERLPEWGKENILPALGLDIIDPDDVNLTPGADNK